MIPYLVAMKTGPVDLQVDLQDLVTLCCTQSGGGVYFNDCKFMPSADIITGNVNVISWITWQVLDVLDNIIYKSMWIYVSFTGICQTRYLVQNVP